MIHHRICSGSDRRCLRITNALALTIPLAVIGSARGQVQLVDRTVEVGLSAVHAPANELFPGTQEWMTGGMAVGDFNNDGTVNMADFTILASNMYGHLDGVSGFGNGDMNRDGRIDMADFHDFVGVFPGVANAANAVPEPSSMMLASFLILLLGVTRSRRAR